MEDANIISILFYNNFGLKLFLALQNINSLSLMRLSLNIIYY